MKGMAGIESIREAYPLRDQLELKTFELQRSKNILSKSQDLRRMEQQLE